MKYAHQRQHKQKEKPRYERDGSKIVIVENGAESEERYAGGVAVNCYDIL